MKSRAAVAAVIVSSLVSSTLLGQVSPVAHAAGLHYPNPPAPPKQEPPKVDPPKVDPPKQEIPKKPAPDAGSSSAWWIPLLVLLAPLVAVSGWLLDHGGHPAGLIAPWGRRG